MKVLIAEDDRVSWMLLEKQLKGWGYEVVSAENGQKALEIYRRSEIPLVVTDWMMPQMDGIELIRRIRTDPKPFYTYIILLTSKTTKDDLVLGMNAGADDFIVKPFDKDELLVRVKAGERIIKLETELAGKIGELQHSLDHIKTLQGLLPICMYCKKIRQDDDYWQGLESYLTENSDATLTHGICPDCYEKYVKAEFDKAARKREAVSAEQERLEEARPSG